MKVFSSVLYTLIFTLFLSGSGAFAARTIVIDAGHGGHDRGGMPGQRVEEKTYALDVAKRVNSKLRGAGYRTVMTRSGDYYVGLGQRCAIAKSHPRSVFVSIHFNGAANYKAYGIETYYYGSRESGALAAAIHRNVLSATGSIDRRVRNRGFYVLRHNRAPAVLCELGFLTNKYEARKISGSGYRDKLASAVARAVMQRY